MRSKKTKVLPATAVKSSSPAKESWRSTDLIPALLLILYVINGLIPDLGAVKASGTQWLYLSLLNLGGILYILKFSCFTELKEISSAIFSRLYLTFFIVAGVSIFFALNKVESIVSYGEFVNTITAYVIVAVLLYNRLYLFRIIALVFTALLFIESISTLSTFSKGLETMEFDKLILSLRGNAGNKNILAATLVIKIPFVIWILRTSGLAMKIFAGITIALAGVTIFIINSRSAYLSLFGLIVLYILFEIITLAKQKNVLQAVLKKAAWVVVPVALAFFISQQVLKNAIESQGTTGFGTVTERLSSISLSEQGTTARTLLWKNAIDFIKKHPVTGGGYGNWKIQAFPYDLSFYNDFIISYNVHNDFLEYTAESGIGAGLLYISLFICLGLYVIRTWLVSRSEEHKQYAAFALMALAVYFVDAVLNFPHEIPFMQFMFISSAGLITNTYLKSGGKKATGNTKAPAYFTYLISGLLIVSILAAWLALKSYKSMVVQFKMDTDLSKEKPEIKADDLIRDLPSLPDLSARGLPLDEFKALYLTNEKRYTEALAYLDKVPKSNPYIAIDDLLRARIYGENKKHDSALVYAVKGFFAAPRGRSGFELLLTACYNNKDTAMMTKAFHEFIKYRNEAWTWNAYLQRMESLPYLRNHLDSIANIALKLFPNDKDILKRKTEINNNQPIVNQHTGATDNSQVNNISAGNTNTNNQNVSFDSAYNNKSNEIFKKASDAYAKADYKTSIKFMLEYSDRNKTDYRPLENVGFAYYAMADFKNAITYFEKVLAMRTSKDGKSEFYMGNCYLMLSDKKQACKYLQFSMQKKYPEAKGTYNVSCKDSTSQK